MSLCPIFFLPNTKLPIPSLFPIKTPYTWASGHLHISFHLPGGGPGWTGIKGLLSACIGNQFLGGLWGFLETNMYNNHSHLGGKHLSGYFLYIQLLAIGQLFVIIHICIMRMPWHSTYTELGKALPFLFVRDTDILDILLLMSTMRIHSRLHRLLTLGFSILFIHH